MKSALIVVDVQEDFLPPNGALAVTDGHAVVDPINQLLSYNWDLKVSTRDWHPKSHISFASNHKNAEPFQVLEFRIPLEKSNDSLQTQNHSVWPDHCIHDSPGAEYFPGFDQHKIDIEVKKGMLQDREYYSAFQDVWGLHHTELADVLKRNNITHVFVVGLAFDFCVYHTAVDAASLGWTTFVIKDACRSVYPERDQETEVNYSKGGVKVIDLESTELKKLQ